MIISIDTEYIITDQTIRYKQGRYHLPGGNNQNTSEEVYNIIKYNIIWSVTY